MTDPIRPKDLATTATTVLDDDYIVVDGATSGTRKMLANASRDRARGMVSIMEFITAKADRDAIRSHGAGPDLTSVFDTATAQIHDAGGGTLFLPAGTYYGTCRLARTGVTTCDLRGERGTRMAAAANGGFAVTVGSVYANPTIDTITFVGVDIQRGGICAAERMNLQNIFFHRCIIGLVSTDNYYGHFSDIEFFQCDVGMIFGIYTESARTITDLVSEFADGLSVTLPVFAANPEGHAGNKLLTNIKMQQVRVGILMEGAPSVPLMNIVKGSFEQCQVGIASLTGGATCHSMWFEANGNTGTVPLNGHTLKKASIYMAGGGLTLSSGTTLFGVIKTDPGPIEVAIDDVSFFEKPDFHAETGYFINRAYADTIHIPYVIERPMPALNNNRAIWCYGRHKAVKRYVPPINGDVMISESFEGSALVSTRVTVAGTKTFETAGGLWPSQKCLQTVTAADSGIVLILLNRGSGVKNCILTLTLKSDKAMTLFMPNFGFTFVVENGQIPIPANKWVTVVVHGRATLPLDGDSWINFTDFSGDATVQLSALQLLTFDSRGLAAEAVAEPFFYVNETIA
jgi:hypothetical protein